MFIVDLICILICITPMSGPGFKFQSLLQARDSRFQFQTGRDSRFKIDEPVLEIQDSDLVFKGPIGRHFPCFLSISRELRRHSKRLTNDDTPLICVWLTSTNFLFRLLGNVDTSGNHHQPATYHHMGIGKSSFLTDRVGGLGDPLRYPQEKGFPLYSS